MYLADINLKKRVTSKLNNKPRNRKLTVTPISDYRKCTIDLILPPYLIAIKDHLERIAFEKIMYWAQKCNGLRSLSPSSHYFENKIRTAVQTSLQTKIPPITLTNLKLKYPDWFGILPVA